MGHYVCWNCSNDIRMPAMSESQIVEEYRQMQAEEEVRLERRNRAFFLVLVGLLFILAAGNLLLNGLPGTSVLFVALALFPLWWSVKATRRMKRIQQANSS
jgi:uncharacterized membrane protein YobD (UPF0266 family)